MLSRRVFFGGFSVPLGTYEVERDLGDLKYMLNDSKEETVIHLVRKSEPSTPGNSSSAGNFPRISLRTHTPHKASHKGKAYEILGALGPRVQA